MLIMKHSQPLRLSRTTERVGFLWGGLSAEEPEGLWRIKGKATEGKVQYPSNQVTQTLRLKMADVCGVCGVDHPIPPLPPLHRSGRGQCTTITALWWWGDFVLQYNGQHLQPIYTRVFFSATIFSECIAPSDDIVASELTK